MLGKGGGRGRGIRRARERGKQRGRGKEVKILVPPKILTFTFLSLQFHLVHASFQNSSFFTSFS